MDETRAGGMHTKSWSESLKGKDHLEDSGVGVRIMLNFFLIIGGLL
jgi:hypothetical protein